MRLSTIHLPHVQDLFHKNDRDYQAMAHPVKDYSHRDIYDVLDRKMGSNHTPTPKYPYMISEALVVLAVLFVSGYAFTLFWGFMSGGPLSIPFKSMGIVQHSAPNGAMSCFMDILTFSGGASKVFYLVNIVIDGIFITMINKMWKTQNIRNNPKILDRYNKYDAYIQPPEKLAMNYDIFPDAGMHSGVNVSTVLAHIPLTNQGLKKVKIVKRYSRDTYVQDQFGRKVLKKKGSYMRDENGNLIMETKPLIDSAFTQALLDTSFVPKGKQYRHLYNPTRLKYNPDKRIGKQNQLYVSQHINQDWHMEPYEVQRPGGMYVVDTAPANTMVLAITRAGKGQTIIEPTIDMWTRMDNKANIVVNDPKGELYVEFYYPASMRGYDVITFNLIDERHTSIYNPLGYAVEASRHGDSQQAVEFVNQIGNTLFPADKADDPMWPNAANAAFKRSALGLIDYYQDEDNAMRDRATRGGWDQHILSVRLDELWSHVNLNYVYQMMTQLAAQKSGDIGDPKNPNDLGFIAFSKDEKKQLAQAQKQGAGTKDYLTLFFDAERHLPTNALRVAIANQDNNLRSMAKSEKTLASVYGISLTAMNFFTDDAIAGLTSGRPSQNFDMAGLGFPRRIQVRFDADYLKNQALQGQHFKWDAFKDVNFTHKLQGKDFEHEGDVDPHGWASFIFKGIFPSDSAYIRLRMYDHTSHLLLKVYYFEFQKDYQKSVDGMTFVYHPVTHKRIISGGTLREIMPKNVRGSDGQIEKVFADRDGTPLYGDTTYNKTEISLADDNNSGYKQVTDETAINDGVFNDSSETKYGVKQNLRVRAFAQTSIHYTEKPKFVDFIMPPNKSSYARIGLILYDQMFNVQVSKSYLTKANQKPLYMTKYMLDELGNLKSNGKGIPNLQTKLSIGLGQNQQYTLILQTLQQLKDVYGEKVDKIIQGDVAHLIFLKSTDDAMIDTLSKMSGTMHVLTDSHSTSKNTKKILGSNDSKVGSNMSVKEVPVLTKNDFMLIPRDSAYILGAGNPIVSMRQLALPMSWRLLKNTLQKPGVKYSLGTVPSTVNNDGFNELQNMPDFYQMVEHRVRQAKIAPKMKARYMVVYHKNDAAMAKIDDEVLSKELMRNINAQIDEENFAKAQRDKESKDMKAQAKEAKEADDSDSDEPGPDSSSSDNSGPDKGGIDIDKASKELEDSLGKDRSENSSFKKAKDTDDKYQEYLTKPIYAGGRLAKNDLCGTNGAGTETYADNPDHRNDPQFATAYANCIQDFKKDPKFNVTPGGSLFMSNDTREEHPLIASINDKTTYRRTMMHLKAAAKDDSNQNLKMVEGDGKDSDAITYRITDKFILYLASLKNWDDVAGGHFDKEVAQAIEQE